MWLQVITPWKRSYLEIDTLRDLDNLIGVHLRAGDEVDLQPFGPGLRLVVREPQRGVNAAASPPSRDAGS